MTVRDEVIVLVDRLLAEAEREYHEARWPSRRGEPVPVSGGDRRDPTFQASGNLDRTNMGRYEQIMRFLRKVRDDAQAELDRPAKRKRTLRRCARCHDYPAPRRSGFDGKWLCAKCAQWEWANKQQRPA